MTSGATIPPVTAAPPPSWGNRLAGVEGLRAVAAISVVVAHTVILLGLGPGVPTGVGKISSAGLQGVTLFFVLSGFLLYRPYATRAVHREPPIDTLAFLRNRVLRIWPAYLVVLLVVSFALKTATTTALRVGQPPHIGAFTDVPLLLANAGLVQGFFPAGMLTGLGISWSLVPEITFYAVLPLFGLAACSAARRLGRPVLAAAAPPVFLLLVGITGRTVMYLSERGVTGERLAVLQSGASWHDVVSRSILGQGDLFALGMLVAVAAAAGMRGRRLSGSAAVAIVVGLVLWASTSESRAGLFAGLFFAGVLTLVVVTPGRVVGTPLRRVLEWPPIRYLGKISYSIYLWHYPLLLFLNRHVTYLSADGRSALYTKLFVTLALTIALASVTYFAVEAPALRLKVRTGTGRRRAGVVTTAA